MSMHVVGLDLSLTSTGVAVITHESTAERRVRLDRVESKGGTTDTLADRHARLTRLVDIITCWVTCDTELVVVEGPSYGQGRQGGQHDRAGLWWLVMSKLYDLADARLYSEPLYVAEVPPALVKRYATGRGNAPKDEVLAAVVRRYPDVPIAGNDQGDALVLAAMGSRHLGYPIDTMPQTHLAAMGKVRWP